MNSAKMHRILISIATGLMAIMFALSAITLFSTPKTADASISAIASTYFTGVNKVEFKDNAVVAEITEDQDVLTIDNALVVSNFGLELKADAQKLNSFTVVFESDAYYANGNVINDKLEEKVVNKLTFNFVDGKYYFNEQVDNAKTFDTTSNVTLKTKIEDNYLVATTGDFTESVVADDVKKDNTVVEYRKVKSVAGMTASNLSFEFDVKDGSTEFSIISIDQNVGVDGYKQEFITGDLKSANPRVMVNEDFYLKADGTVKKNVMKNYSLTLTPYAVFDEVISSDLYLESDNDNVWFENADKPKMIQFCKTGNYTLNVRDDENVYETMTSIEVVDFTEDENAPVYITTPDDGAKASVELALKEAYYDSESDHYKPLGTSIELPSLKDFVSDDFATYEELKTTVYYNTDTKDASTSSSLSLTLNEAGDYNYCVVFADTNGNTMDYEEDFVDGVDNNKPQYKDYVFRFHVADDAPLSVVAPKSQGVGYVGVAYYASKFTIDAVGCTTTYKLYYNADAEATADSEGWILIPSASSITDQEYNEDGYDYETIQSISYASGLNFTPDKVGLYMIECSVTSSASSRSATEYTFISVESEPMEVKVPSTWLKDNVWSVVFLSVGTLCLIGIIILLCIKPKEETEE